MAEPKSFFRRLFGGLAQPERSPEAHLDPDRAEPREDLARPAQPSPAAADADTALAPQEPPPPPPPAPAAPFDLRATLAAEAAAARAERAQRLRKGLARSSEALSERITAVFTKRRLDAATLEEFEDALIQADLGLDAAQAVTEALARGRFGRELGEDEVKAILAAEVERVLKPVALPLVLDPSRKPNVILVVGVNGTGKTTTIGKLAAKFAAEGRSVVLAAGDTFRAAAIDQLKIWGQRAGARVVAGAQGADAAGLVFDALAQAQAAGADILLIDTAGRLQNRTELMAELEKVIRVIRKKDPTAPHSVLLTLDATTGQNALNQVEIFGKVAGVTGLAMTKLDGTARGGILVAIASRYGLPVHFIGVGEKVEDLEPFAAADFARAIAGL